MKSPHRSMRVRRFRSSGSNSPSQLLLPNSSGHVGWVVSVVVAMWWCVRGKAIQVVWWREWVKKSMRYHHWDISSRGSFVKGNHCDDWKLTHRKEMVVLILLYEIFDGTYISIWDYSHILGYWIIYVISHKKSISGRNKTTPLFIFMCLL